MYFILSYWKAFVNQRNISLNIITVVESAFLIHPPSLLSEKTHEQNESESQPMDIPSQSSKMIEYLLRFFSDLSPIFDS